MCHFSLTIVKIFFFLFALQKFNYDVWVWISLAISYLGIYLASWNYRLVFFLPYLGSFNHYFFEYFLKKYFVSPTLFLSFWDFDDMNVRSFVIFPQSPKFFLFFNLFSYYCSNWVNFIDLPSSSLILSSIISNYCQVHPVSYCVIVFNILVIVFFSSIIFICFFFITPHSLLRYSIFFRLFQESFNWLSKHCFMTTTLKSSWDNSSIWFFLELALLKGN